MAFYDATMFMAGCHGLTACSRRRVGHAIACTSYDPHDAVQKTRGSWFSAYFSLDPFTNAFTLAISDVLIQNSSIEQNPVRSYLAHASKFTVISMILASYLVLTHIPTFSRTTLQLVHFVLSSLLAQYTCFSPSNLAR